MMKGVCKKKCPKIQLTHPHICEKVNINTLTLLSRYPKWFHFMFENPKHKFCPKKKWLGIKLTIQLQFIKTSYKRVDMSPIRMCNMTLESSFQKYVNLHLQVSKSKSICRNNEPTKLWVS
jgi:hypothetical protein